MNNCIKWHKEKKEKKLIRKRGEFAHKNHLISGNSKSSIRTSDSDIIKQRINKC